MEGARQAGERRTFHTLDLLRGLAALAVVGRHLNGSYARWMPGSHLAVDLFFVLSGFVIAHAYADRLAAGMCVRAFMRIRLIRLYPLYLLGSLLGIAAAALAANIGQGGTANVGEWLLAVALALIFLPAPFFDRFHLYPFDFVAWSLLWELVVNALYALVATRLSARWLAAWLVAGAALIVVSSHQFDGLATGSNTFNWIGGPQRVGYSFAAGIAAHRLWQAGRFGWLRVPPPVAAAILLAVFILRPAGGAPVFDATAVLVVFPLLVFAATAEPAARWNTLCTRLGLASYAIYALHPPVVKLVEAALFRLGPLPPLGRAAIESGIIVAILVAALAADRWFDRPVRRQLSRVA